MAPLLRLFASCVNTPCRGARALVYSDKPGFRGRLVAGRMDLAGADQPVRKVTIIGGGTAGWMIAGILSQWLSKVHIRLIESEQIGTVGVGEATIPHIRKYLALAGVDPMQMVRESNATFKLGIQFVDWGAPGESYMHGFGKIDGRTINMLQAIERMATDRMTIDRNAIGFKFTNSDSQVETPCLTGIHGCGFTI